MSNKYKQTFILGAGAVGHLLACKFKQANYPATLIHRNPEHLSASTVCYQDNKQQQHRLQLSYTMARDVTQIDYLLVAVKAHQLRTALQTIQHGLHTGSQLLLLCNGMGNLETASDCLSESIPPENIWPAINTHGCYLDVNNNHLDVIHSGMGEITFGGNYKINHSNSIANFTLPASLNSDYVADIELRLWLKLAINAVINPLTAIYDCQNGDLASNEQLRAKVTTLIKEIAELYKLLGIALTETQINSSCWSVIKATAKNYSSMQRDIKNNKITEIEVISGYLLKYAQRMQFHMQEHQYLYQQIKNIEQGHKLDSH